MGADCSHAVPGAVLLFSGGLDSILAAEVLRRAGVEVILLRHTSIFFPPADGDFYVPPCPVVRADISEQMARLVAEPEYGYGSNANPCLDCKQMMYRRAWGEAQKRDADFVATGEVLGQRPMTQHRGAFRRMEKGAGVEGRVVRPLSGKLLPATIPEEEGLIEREDLLDISGRSRSRQMELAERWGISRYPSPAGGCRLTDPNFAERVFALQQMGYAGAEHLRAVRSGRLFELSEDSFVLVGRSHEDNMQLLADAPADALMLELRQRPGPLACLVGSAGEDQLRRARALVIRYSRFPDADPEAVGTWSVEQMRRRKEE